MPKQAQSKEGLKRSIQARKQLREVLLQKLETDGIVTIQEAIVMQRKILGLTQQQLALRAGVGVNQVRAIERGQGNPTINSINQLLEALGQLRLYAAHKKI